MTTIHPTSQLGRFLTAAFAPAHDQHGRTIEAVYRDLVDALGWSDRRDLAKDIDRVVTACVDDDQVRAALGAAGWTSSSTTETGMQPRAWLFSLRARASVDPGRFGHGLDIPTPDTTPVLGQLLRSDWSTAPGATLDAAIGGAELDEVKRLRREVVDVLAAFDDDGRRAFSTASGARLDTRRDFGMDEGGWLAWVRHRATVRIGFLQTPAIGGDGSRWPVAAYDDELYELRAMPLTMRRRALHRMASRFLQRRAADLPLLFTEPFHGLQDEAHAFRLYVLQELILAGEQPGTERFVQDWYDSRARRRQEYGWLPVDRGRFETDDTGWERTASERLRSSMTPGPTRPEAIPVVADGGGTGGPLEQSTEVQDAARTAAIRAPFHWWHVEAKVVRTEDALDAGEVPATLLSLGLEALRPGPDPATLRVARATPTEAWAELFIGSAGGGAYGSPGAVTQGRAEAARAMGALAGAPADADFETIEDHVLRRRWWVFTADTDWHHGDGWESGVASLSDDGRELAVVVASDTC
jgi:hypothetical protein